VPATKARIQEANAGARPDSQDSIAMVCYAGRACTGRTPTNRDRVYAPGRSSCPLAPLSNRPPCRFVTGLSPERASWRKGPSSGYSHKPTAFHLTVPRTGRVHLPKSPPHCRRSQFAGVKSRPRSARLCGRNALQILAQAAMIPTGTNGLQICATELTALLLLLSGRELGGGRSGSSIGHRTRGRRFLEEMVQDRQVGTAGKTGILA
jgi:hypothetical protein